MSWEKASGRLSKAAQYYAEKHNWKILPVHGIGKDGKCTCGKTHFEAKEIGKHPAINSWQTSATDDTEQIATWWGENPDYNVGVFAKGSGFLVIDIDPRHKGDESYIKLEERTEGALPPTVEAATGLHSDNGNSVRGRHLIYKCSPNEKFIGNFNSEGLPGIDVKHNGYILLTPSRHFSGLTYEWKPGHAPWEREIAEAPEALLQALRPKKKPRGVGVYGSATWDWMGDLELGGEKVDIQKIMEEGIDEGARAVDIYKLTCALANKYGTDDANRTYIETLMIRFNAEMVRPPMELEGSNSLLMHVHRAIDFVADNPKVDLKWEGISDWVRTQGTDWATKMNQQQPKALEGGEILEPEVLENVDIPENRSTANAIGDQVTALAESGMSISDASSKGNLNLPSDPDAPDELDGGKPGFRSLTDIGNGARLVDTYKSVIRYTPGLGWYYWDGNYWKQDQEELELKELAKRVSAVVAGEVKNYNLDDPKVNELVAWAKQAKSIARVNNMVRMATSDRKIRVDVESWDADPHLMGVSNGVVDLRTGELLRGRPDLNITRRSPISYQPGMTNIRWTQFLDFATGGDKEYQDWLQRAVGYTLTGLSNQDVLFMVYGPPGSGKNTFVETVFEALGPGGYAWMLDSPVLAADGGQNRSDEYHMAELRGRRMVWVDELPETERIKENQVKKLTGSSQISARSPGEKPFTFHAQGKVWITTNHRPMITDDAMWRRLRPAPFVHVPEKSDPDLKSYLADPDGGLPAVLSWCVEGAVKYLSMSKTSNDALGWCTAVKEAADIYQKSEDRIGIFLSEETVNDENSSIKVQDLYTIYRRWSENRGERGLSQIAFHKKLSDRGTKINGHGARAQMEGIGLAMNSTGNAGDGLDYSQLSRFSNF